MMRQDNLFAYIEAEARAGHRTLPGNPVKSLKNKRQKLIGNAGTLVR